LDALCSTTQGKADVWNINIEGFTYNKFAIKWDFSAIPVGSTINSANFTIVEGTAEPNAGRSGCIGAWMLDTVWDVSACYHYSSLDNHATWLYGIPGALSVSYNPPLDTACGSTAQAGLQLVFDLSAGVKHYVDFPDSNYGFLIDGLSGSFRFIIGEPNAGGTPPMLNVNYTVGSKTETAQFTMAPKGLRAINAGSQVSFQLTTPSLKNQPISIYGIGGNLVATIQGSKTGYGFNYSWNTSSIANGLYYAVSADRGIKAASVALAR
jgi:hypothetical protein